MGDTETTAIHEFVERLAGDEGAEPLSEAKMMALAEPHRRVVITEDDRILAVGVIGDHPQPDGTTHRAIETAVEPAMQFPAFERACLEATLDVAGGDSISVWSRRSTLDAALSSIGFAVVRTLRLMVVDLPLGHPLGHHGERVRPLRDDEIDALVSLNNLAFARHREAGGLTRDAFDEITAEPWFDPDGIVVVEDGDGLAAFCWTKVHPNGDGEIYRVGVRPDLVGTGLGRTVTVAGFDDLAERRGCMRGTLWVDDDNRPAIRLYESLGMATATVNREFERM